MHDLPKEIFKAYDIRGIVGQTLTPEIAEAVGHAIGSEASVRGIPSLAIGRDGRTSGPEL
ncbi:MAG TPA: phosphomannomutase/phosphoglucomutase, partial [Nitrosospira sp.]